MYFPFNDNFIISRPNSLTLGAALPRVASNRPAEREVDRMNGSRDPRGGLNPRKEAAVLHN